MPPLNFLTHRSRSGLIVALPGLISLAQMRPSEGSVFQRPFVTSRLLRTAGEKRSCLRAARVTLGESRHGWRDDVSTADVTRDFRRLRWNFLLGYFVNLNNCTYLFDN